MARADYSAPEVKALIECYTEIREMRDTAPSRLKHLVRVADLDRAIRYMPPKEYQAVLLYGLLGHTVRDAEQLLGVHKSTLQDRYDRGIEWLTTYLNEGVSP